jgi:site-specific DNA recombinase
VTTTVYARISLDRDGTEIGVSNQVDAGRDLCQRRAWPAPAVLVDDDLSATYGGPRPAYERLLAAIQRGEVTRVVVFHLSRLWRNRAERAAGIEIMRNHGVSVDCVRGPSLDMSTAYGRAMAGLLGEFDTMEVEVKSERQLLAIRARAEKGLPHWTSRAFGYESDGVTVRESEAVALRAACEAILAGAHLTDVAREWNAAGLLSARSAKPWRWTSVRTVLTNPRNAGIRAHKGSEVGPAVWPAIVPEETYRAVVAHLAHPDRRTGGTGVEGIRLLTGIALCGVPGCGLRVNGGGRARGGPLYRCPSQRHLSRLSDPVDDWVSEHVVARLERPDAAELLEDRSRPDVLVLRKQAQALRAKIAATRREFAESELMSPAELREILADQRGRLGKIEDQMADAGRVDLLGPLITAEDVVRAWAMYERPRQRLVVDMLMTVRVLPPGRGARLFDPNTVPIEPKM